MGICFSLQCFPVACLPKLAVKNNKTFLFPFASRAATERAQQTFKTTVSVMTIKVKRLELKML